MAYGLWNLQLRNKALTFKKHVKIIFLVERLPDRSRADRYRELDFPPTLALGEPLQLTKIQGCIKFFTPPPS